MDRRPPQLELDLSRLIPQARRAARIFVDGRVTKVVGIMAEAHLAQAAIGDLCHIHTPHGPVPAEVAGFLADRVQLMPLGELRGIGVGARVIRHGGTGRVMVGPELLGRVIDGFGRPIDGRPLPTPQASRDLYARPLSPLEREPVRQPLYLGIRALDGLLTCGRGQRVGIMAGPGVGKTVLLSMIARRAAYDVMVMALVGERGREVNDFVHSFSKSPEFGRMAVVASTSDRPAPERLRAAFLATAVAEYFRDQGLNVLLVMDSLTRVAMAQREVGLAVGEPPTTKGYTPSVFAKLPSLLERAGAKAAGGSITGIYTVLMEGDDMSDPIADAAIAILDGQIVLSRRLAGMGHFPAVDLLKSVSRVMPDVTEPAHWEAARRLRETVSLLADSEDLINIGAYEPGKNPRLDEALQRKGSLFEFLRQGTEEVTPPSETLRWLARLAGMSGGAR
ncbi:MAG: FliI/YscN family ATPase [Deltaproteobacteria bacterium]|nr:FliI/YscN family ATPase [Deltaproteobacteria bacterium]